MKAPHRWPAGGPRSSPARVDGFYHFPARQKEASRELLSDSGLVGDSRDGNRADLPTAHAAKGLCPALARGPYRKPRGSGPCAGIAIWPPAPPIRGGPPAMSSNRTPKAVLPCIARR